jgi:hypothetical protein
MGFNACYTFVELLDRERERLVLFVKRENFVLLVNVEVKNDNFVVVVVVVNREDEEETRKRK